MILMRETRAQAWNANQVPVSISQVAILTKVTKMISKLLRDLGIVNTNNKDSERVTLLHMGDVLWREASQ